MRQYHLAVLAVLALTPSCMQRLSPRRLTGSYRFVCVNDCTLPIPSSHTERCVTWLTGGDLVLRRDATFTVAWRDSTSCRAPEEVTVPITRRVYNGRYTLAGPELALSGDTGVGWIMGYVGDTLAWGHTATAVALHVPVMFAFVRARLPR